MLDRWSVKRPEIMVRLTELTRAGDARPGGFQECDALPWFDHRLWRKALPWKIPRYWGLEMWVPQDSYGHTNSVQQWTYVVDTNSPGLRWKWDRAQERAQERAEACYFVSGTEGIGGF